MRVCLKNIHKTNLQDNISVIKKFCEMLQNEMKLSDDVHINFVSERDRPMTTGVRMPHHEIFILSGNRMLIDVLRTLSHEWVHEYQVQKMGVPDEEPIQDIGGPEENMASVLSSIFLKKFQKKYPQFEKKLFGE